MSTVILDCESIRARMEAGAKVIDVRSAAEFARGAVKGAINIPLQQIPTVLEDLDKDGEYYCYCVSGARSNEAVTFMQALGFSNTHNLGSIRSYLACLF